MTMHIELCIDGWSYLVWIHTEDGVTRIFVPGSPELSAWLRNNA